MPRIGSTGNSHTPATPPSPWQVHQLKWSLGCGSSLCSRENTKVCLGRGRVPCDVLFVGEAPGESENDLGYPFAGPAGHLLNRIIKRAIGTMTIGFDEYDRDTHPVCAYSNLTGCIPRSVDGGKAGEPEHEDILCCRPRLEELIQIAKPRLIVCVGDLAEEYFKPGYKHSVRYPAKTPVVKIKHPAAIIRSNVAQQGLDEQRCIVTIRNAVEDIFLEEKDW